MKKAYQSINHDLHKQVVREVSKEKTNSDPLRVGVTEIALGLIVHCSMNYNTRQSVIDYLSALKTQKATTNFSTVEFEVHHSQVYIIIPQSTLYSEEFIHH